MRPHEFSAGLLAAALAATCGGAGRGAFVEAARLTTSGAIAVANLDAEIAQDGEDEGVEELLLARSRFLGDYDALDRASSVAERRFETGGELLRRARVRAAVHRFADALVDLAAAEHAGANRESCAALQASIFVATGRASEVVPSLEADVDRHASFASRSALAGAYAAVGRLEDADRMYVAALGDLDTTAPFPYAWVYFARGTMWVERAGDTVRGEALYRRALAHLPEFVAANIHLAELEIARGELTPAIARLERVESISQEPAALALLGELRVRTGDQSRGEHEIGLARRRYESLLASHPLAFADHAVEFFLGPGNDPERAWALAQKNLANRRTDRAFALAIDAARATGRRQEMRALEAERARR
jgi:tetratricopeptide (TPR) repeat protein